LLTFFASTTIHRNDGQSGEAHNRQGNPQRDIGLIASLRNFDLLQRLKQKHRAFSITIHIACNTVMGKARQDSLGGLGELMGFTETLRYSSRISLSFADFRSAFLFSHSFFTFQSASQFDAYIQIANCCNKRHTLMRNSRLGCVFCEFDCITSVLRLRSFTAVMCFALHKQPLTSTTGENVKTPLTNQLV